LGGTRQPDFQRIADTNCRPEDKLLGFWPHFAPPLPSVEFFDNVSDSLVNFVKKTLLMLH